MSFGKGFGAALGIYLGANIGLGILYYLVGLGLTFDQILGADALTGILSLLVGPSVSPPTVSLLSPLVSLILGGELINTLLLLVWLFVPGLLAALIGGKLAEGAGAGFGAMFLTILISAIIYMVVYNFIADTSILVAALQAWAPGITESDTIVLFTLPLLLGLINGIFYGGLAAVVGGRESF
ncbi:MAG: hypothetical protein Kow0069_19270 [Promethearchaeota archaeon]